MSLSLVSLPLWECMVYISLFSGSLRTAVFYFSQKTSVSVHMIKNSAHRLYLLFFPTIYVNKIKLFYFNHFIFPSLLSVLRSLNNILSYLFLLSKMQSIYSSTLNVLNWNSSQFTLIQIGIMKTYLISTPRFWLEYWYCFMFRSGNYLIYMYS